MRGLRVAFSRTRVGISALILQFSVYLDEHDHLTRSSLGWRRFLPLIRHVSLAIMPKRTGSPFFVVLVKHESIYVFSSVPRCAQRTQVVVRRRPSYIRFLVYPLAS
jgi:hypothetical protein